MTIRVDLVIFGRMREIKFRAWSKTNGLFLEDFNLIDLNKPDSMMNISQNNYQDFVIQQYTGLKDKNGKEIYEGDIIAQLERINFEEPKIYYRLINYQTALDNVTKTFITGWNAGVSQFINQDCEVIGNIFENPDLLK